MRSNGEERKRKRPHKQHPTTGRRRAFASFSWRPGGDKYIDSAAQAAAAQDVAGRKPAGALPASATQHPIAPPVVIFGHVLHMNRVIASLMVAGLVITGAQAIVEVFFTGESLLASFQGELDVFAYRVAYLVLTFLVTVGLVAVITLDRHNKIFEARLVIRSLIVLLVIGLLVQIILYGISWQTSFYVFQFICVIAYQIYNDPNLSRPPRFVRREDRDEARAKVYELDPDRRGYIPLNFFNLFWIFMVACVLGLIFETIYCQAISGVWKDRSCFLWGPFSAIYGVGAVLMTVAVNRWWYRNAGVIFLITGLIGAAFEFFVSWYMETAFGMYSWDYSGSFLSIDGRTDFAHFCVWGFVGVVWICMVLPTIMRFVEAIPLRWRASVTVAVFAFMLVDATMTVMALNCWAERAEGIPITTDTQQFFAEYFDDEFMESKFETLHWVE